MKFLKVLPVAALAVAAVSCQNGSNGELTSSSTQTDSLMYYLGQMNAADYLRDAARDTVMKSESEKMVYMKGIRDALSTLKPGNDTYNKGFMLGVQMAAQMISFSEQMEVTINREAYAGSLERALRADTIPNSTLVTAEFRKVMQNIEQAKSDRDKAASRVTLKEEAAKESLPEVTEDLYGKVTTTTDSATIVSGDDVKVKATFTKPDGEELRFPLPPKGKVGNSRSFPDVISDALMSMKAGETGEFITTAHALLGGRVQQMGIEPSTVLKMNLTVNLVPKEKPEEAKDAKDKK